jgi:hypothetical protein
MPSTVVEPALSVRQLSRRWQVAPQKIREMIRRGLLAAFDVGRNRPQLRISDESIREAESRLAVRPTIKRRPRHDAAEIDPEVQRLLDADD